MEKKHVLDNDDELLERRTGWDGQHLVNYEGFWFPEMFLPSIRSSRNNFIAKNTDIILATVPKSGTTWLKALTFSVANRGIYTVDQSPLLKSNPHKLVPFIEEYIGDEYDKLLMMENVSDRRILSSHVPFGMLPCSVAKSECKIIYLCRNPLDQFISLHHFFANNKIEKEAVPLGFEESFDMFCQGIIGFGPFWEHMIGYWNAHLENPKKVLFLKYEDLKEDIVLNVKKIAEFVGCPFSEEEVGKGVVEEISKLCSFGNLKNLEVNKNGYVMDGVLKNSTFFRKGEVGDWTNYLSCEMAERMKKLMEIKFEGSGLTFKI
ncbi:hypothetical protein ABFX02_05G123900 [Erythranthe guttata]